MCGIAGFWQPELERKEILSEIAGAMARTLVHRGPDDGGIWVDAEAGIGLGHRRLSILDLSSAGHQPMISSCGRHVIVFNGEIYNFLEVKKELVALGHAFRGTSDTEILLEGIARWGVAKLVPRLNGMFALAVWDRKERRLTLARDHIGIKPLYYGWAGDTFVFGSELKALLPHPHFRRRVDRNAIGLLLRFNYVPAPYAIWQDCFKLPPGHMLVLERPAARHQAEAYWSIDNVIDAERTTPDGSPEQAIDELDALLRDAVRLQMVADVPLGAFLSGGVDSSTVVALMQSQSAKRVKTFTIGFKEGEFDEAGHARAVAGHLQTDHTELLVTPKDALEIIPRLATIYDEPFADSSQIPTFLVAQLTRRHVTVSLSGDGGDELFAGYSHYPPSRRLWLLTRAMPSALRSRLAGLLWKLGDPVLNLTRDRSNNRMFRSVFDRTRRYKIQKLAAALAANDPGTFYQNRISRWLVPSEAVREAKDCPLPFAAPRQRPSGWGAVESMAYFDSLNYMPENVLTKVDRASMAVSLEARVPLLDYRVMEFSAKLPMNLKIRNGKGKWLLRQVLYKYAPRKLVDRPKMGFRLPLADWLRGPLRAWAEDLLHPKQLERDGFLVSEPIVAKWKEHLEQRNDWSRHLWSVIMFQAWKRNWM
jgi:asparagine synthase (glutamine-hydrolysing)